MHAIPLVSLIAALSDNRVIGRNNRLPWHLPADLKHFKSLTLNKPLIMGRKTWESLPGLLPQRKHIVLTRDPSYAAEGCVVVNSPEQAIRAAGAVREVMVIGGAEVYERMLPLAKRMYLTRVRGIFDGDAFFPAWDPAQWREVQAEPHAGDERNPHPYRFVILERVSVNPDLVA